MRRAKELKIWKELQARHARSPVIPLAISATVELDLGRPCTVIGGRNGSGKSRLLKTIAAQLGKSAVYLDLHHLCEQALMVLRSVGDIEDMKDELGRLGPDGRRIDDVKRVVGRDYESVDWFALDIGPEDNGVASKFRWAGTEGDSPLTPYFTVSYAGTKYGALDMGLGEFSVHFLFWIIEQFKDVEEITLLLDEPDAYLPPVGVERLLARLLGVCQERGWRVVLSTHSEEMIASAVDHRSFLLLSLGVDGVVDASHSEHDPLVADTLLSRPPIERLLFVEDESAWYLCRALLDRGDHRLSRATSILWGDGSGYIASLRQRLPRPPKSDLSFVMVPDGDQRDRMSDAPVDGRWPLHFLPSQQDPDGLFRSLRADPESLAAALNVDAPVLRRKLDSLEGEDDHDWVNQLGDAYGRAHVLTVLARCWADSHIHEAREFAALVRSGS